jgi:hypothetical protein
MINSNSSPAVMQPSINFESSQNSMEDRQQMHTIGEETEAANTRQKPWWSRSTSPCIFTLALLLLLLLAAAVVIPVILSVSQTPNTTATSTNSFFSFHSEYHR